MTQRFLLSLLALIILSLSACQPTQETSPTRPDNSADIAALASEQSGDYLAAAEQYLALAEQSKKQTRSHYYLRAALTFWRADDKIQAKDSLNKVKRELLGSSQQFDAALLDAQILMASSQPEQALMTLDKYTTQELAQSQKLHLLTLRIRAYHATNNWLEKVNSHLKIAQFLTGDDKDKNQQGLWQALMSMTPQSLDLFNPSMPPAIESGWFELAYIVKSYQANPETFIVALEDWQRNYPNHPANPTLYEQDFNAGTQLPKELNHIAVLLPETGPYKSAAAAIKQGIITAHLISQSNTQLHFYPITTTPSNILQQYQQAVSDNASIVIGPLNKQSVTTLAENTELTIPVLALNRLPDDVQYDNLYQFGLAPEDDAIAVANYATDHNFQRAIVLYPNDNWGSRVADAFQQQWLGNKGVLLNKGSYEINQHDFSTTITPLLGLETSAQRHHSLKQTLGKSLEFEPRRRQDIDFVFLVAKPLKARQLVPQLKFHRSRDLPIISTSQAYSGQEDSQQNIDLNALIISEIPWAFTDSSTNDPVYNALKTNRPEHFGNFVRLYALGADAYRLIPQLNKLSRSSNISFPGASGILTIDNAGKVNRETSWGKFEKGMLQALSSED